MVGLKPSCMLALASFLSLSGHATYGQDKTAEKRAESVSLSNGSKSALQPSELDPDKVLKSKLSLPVLNKNIESHPHSAKALFLRGTYYDQIMEPELAITDLNKAIEIDPKYFRAYFARGTAHCELEQFDKGRADLKIASQGDTETAASAFKQMAELSDAMNKPEEAVRYYDKLFKLKPATRDVRAACAYAECLVKVNRVPDALAVAEKNLSANSTSWQANLTAGKIHAQLKQYPIAIAELSRAIMHSPDKPWPYLERSAIYKALGKTELAERDFQSAKHCEKQVVKESPFRSP